MNADAANHAGLQNLLEDPIVGVLRTTFAAAGQPLYLVGGPVRDALRGVGDLSDLDFASSARPDQLQRILAPLGVLWTGGNPFGTIGVSVKTPGRPSMVVEVTTYRRDVYTPTSRKPEVVFGDDIVTDLGRRDLTVNAMALDVHTGELLDPFGGTRALQERVLDTPDEPGTTIREDPLRSLRALRFAAKLQFQIADRLQVAIAAHSDRLHIVAQERRTAELTKLLALSHGRASALATAAELGIAHWLHGDITLTAGHLAALARQHDELHPWAVLASAAGPVAEQSLVDLRVPKSVAAAAANRAALTTQLIDGPPAEDQQWARALLREHSDAHLEAALALAADVGTPAHAAASALDRIRSLDPQVREPLPVTGAELVAAGLAGRQVGAALRRLERRRHLGPLDSQEAWALVLTVEQGAPVRT